MQLCKTCNSLMIGREAPRSFLRIRRMLRSHGAVRATVAAVAESIGPMCDCCLAAMDDTLSNPTEKPHRPLDG
ncbi:MAG TPA: hypothetical protein VGJ26_00485 [Pirellulales bacterium]|jgi:hypothetical protein